MQGFSLNSSAGASHFFTSEEHDLLICGEGHYKALAKTMKILGQKSYDHIVNIGLVGALNNEFKVEDSFCIRTSYHFAENKIHPQSFSLQRPEGLAACDGMTMTERQFSLSGQHPLRAFADVVDRECWGVALAAQEYRTPLLALKMVSDLIHVGESNTLSESQLTTCQNVIESASRFSEKLLTRYQKQILPFLRERSEARKENTQMSQDLLRRLESQDHYLWTVSLKLQLENLVQLKMRTQSDKNQMLDWIAQAEQDILAKHPDFSAKLKTKSLLQKLEETL